MYMRIAFSLLLVFIIYSKTISQTVEIPVFQYVTVDRATQQVHMGWTVNDPSVLNGYIVKRQIFNQPAVIDGSFNTVMTIDDPNIFTAIDNGTSYGIAAPNLHPETYFIVSRAVGPIFSNWSNMLSTIYLHPIDFNLCREQNSLIWTSYNGFGNGGTYRIYYSDTPTGTPVLLNEQPLTDTTFIHAQVAASQQYHYFIEAYSSTGFSSLSNIQGILTTMPTVPTTMNADYASVVYHNQLELSFTVDAMAQVSSYKLLKSKSQNGPWDTIASYPRGTAQITKVDFISTNSEMFYYKVVAMNNCLFESRSSNLAKNIVLEAWPDQNEKYTNQLRWTTYETWLGNVENYKIFRSIDGGAFEQIAQVSNTTLTYSENIETFVVPERNGQQSKGQFCYYIEATEGGGNPNGIVGVSKSNISCAQQEAVVFIPNAFNPKSQTTGNRTFRPVISFVNDYNLTIYNRSGEIVFKSTDPMNGWDGKYNGQLLPKATYVYYLKYRTTDNKIVEKSGQINLVY